jgi:putative membrane-bound dehydrogenase-like protein
MRQSTSDDQIARTLTSAVVLAVAVLSAGRVGHAEDAPPLAPERTVAALALPAGFSATLFAGEPDVMQPIGMAIDDRGRLWIAENLSYPDWKADGHDRITIFDDTDDDGRHDRRTVFYDKLNYVTGLEVGFGGVWVVSAPNLLFIPDRNGDDKPDGAPQVLLDGFGHQGVHNLVNGCTWGPDGWLYGGHGGSSSGMIGRPDASDAQRTFFDGGVWRYHPTRRTFEPFMRGTTNPWGLDFDEYGQAFISNSVTPHLYHVIQGAHVERRRPSPSSAHAYAVLDTIADHRHWIGAEWTESRGGKPEQVALGGGHAHSGLMIYLGGAFPPEYRGRAFMNNIHGDRVNVDLPRRAGSGYRAEHGRDFLVSRDPWFQGLQLRYGPDGTVYLTDWYDTGECHTRKPDRKNGRIYKIAYAGGDVDRHAGPPDVSRLSDEDLVKLLGHPNDWYARHARRVMQERGVGSTATHEALRATLAGQSGTPARLRALWTLHATGGLTPQLATDLLTNGDEHVRAWAVRLICEEPAAAGRDALSQISGMAGSEPSPFVCLHLASAAQRLAGEARWTIVESLAARDEFATDANLPLMTWYALEPLCNEDPERAIGVVARSKLPRLREFIARRIASGDAQRPTSLPGVPGGGRNAEGP